MYESESGKVVLEVRADEDTVWLTRAQMAMLFGRDLSTISRHIANAVREELHGQATLANFATVQREGHREVTREIEHFNLDVVISVGYRVKSAEGVRFRRWATDVLRRYLIDGAAVNERRLAELGKAAHLLYFVVKDHPLADGNKRSAAALFVAFLARNGQLHDDSGSLKVTNGALAALTLLVASSDPREKDLMISLIVRLIDTV